MGRRPGSGVNALLIAYIAVVGLIVGILALVMLGRERPSSSVRLDLPPARDAKPVSVAIGPPPPASPPAIVAPPAPPPAPPTPAPPSGAASPPALPSPPAPPMPGPAASPSAPSPPPADVASALPSSGTNGYPPVPPEKPTPPARKPADPDPAAPTPTSPAGASPPSATSPNSGTPSSTAAAPPIVPAIPALAEKGPYGPLPRIAADGRLPWIVNNARFDHRTRTPRIAILLMGLGLDPKATEDAIVKLPPEVSLAFLPYAANLDRWTRLARDFGHEVLISLPMESGDPATQQALGPRALQPGAGDGENLDRLRWIMSRASGYVGLVTWEGETFLGNDKASLAVLQEISSRGLMLVDSRMAKPNTVQQLAGPIGLPFAKSRGFIDEPRDAATIDANLARLEDLARQQNFAMAMAIAFPTSIERLVNWSRTVTQRGFVLAPVTGVTQCTGLCQTRVQRHAAAVATLQKQ